MTITTESIGTGLGTLYEDTSGGEIILALQHPDYISQHRFRVIPFGSSGSGVFNSPPSGTTANIENEAENLAALLAPLYNSGTSGQFIAVNQVLSDNTGVQPYPYTFGGAAAFANGTGAGTRWPTWVCASFTGLGTDGSKWRVVLPGPDNVAFAAIGRGAYSSQTTAVKALMDYLSGVTNGGVHAQKTNVVTHSGVPIIASRMAVVTGDNKRLRRHFRVN